MRVRGEGWGQGLRLQVRFKVPGLMPDLGINQNSTLLQPWLAICTLAQLQSG